MRRRTCRFRPLKNCACFRIFSSAVMHCCRSSCSVSRNSVTHCAPRLRLNSFASELSLPRSEEHTSELQSLMRLSYAVFCLKKKKQSKHVDNIVHHRNTNMTKHIY